MKTSLFEELGKVAPGIAFEVKHTKDPSFQWDGDGPDPADKGFLAYDVDFYARMIVQGSLIEGASSLGGTYEKPGEFDPDVGGYLVVNLEEALEDLADSLAKFHAKSKDVEKALMYLKDESQRRYDEQRREFAEKEAKARQRENAEIKSFLAAASPAELDVLKPPNRRA